MNLPLPKNKLVVLTLAGGLITALVAVGLSAPNWFEDSEISTKSLPTQHVRTSPDASSGFRTYSGAKNTSVGVTGSRRSRRNFQPAVQPRRSSREEEEAYDEDEEREYEKEEREYDEPEHERRSHEDSDHEE